MPAIKQTLRILSYNVKMLPGPFGKGDADLARLDVIAATVLGMKPGWDVLCLQEVFDEDARARLAKKLKKAFPHQVIKCSDHDVFHEDSGLFFASRFPIAGKGFAEYRASADEDALADKGIFGARVDVKGVQVLIFNTHLQSSVKHSETRNAQLRQARTFIRGALERLPRATESVAIACGDYNVVAEHAVPASDALGVASGGQGDHFRRDRRSPGPTARMFSDDTAHGPIDRAPV